MDKDKKWIIENRAVSFVEEKMPLLKHEEQKEMQSILVEFVESIEDVTNDYYRIRWRP